MADLDPYDQYEASFPMEAAGTCLQQARQRSSCTPCPPLHANVSEALAYIMHMYSQHALRVQWPMEAGACMQPACAPVHEFAPLWVQASHSLWLLLLSMQACHAPVQDSLLAAQLLVALNAQNLRAGFRVPGLIRFGAATDAYIGNTNGGPRMYVNIEDHLSHSTGERNAAFEVGCWVELRALQLCCVL